MMGPSFHLRTPPSWFFKFPPDAAPLALPPPTNARTFASPFAIDEKLYNDVLDWKVPVTIGAIYATTAIALNKYNRDRGNKAWSISKTRAFKWFVVAHNVFLAVFSALTFVGMIRALAHTWPAHRERTLFGKFWPGLRTENGLAGAADALCKMHGPRGFGAGAFYNPFNDNWESKSNITTLGISGTPDSMDVGRLWNEGLAFWGWWFYLSKFYEVLDTFIILAKGKRSSTLQTYHHAGAMMCMWAGIRFMSPPIWMFAFLNSGIHTMMYVYYTLAAVGVKVPQRVKRTLTTLQISQFIIGITFAALHLFVTYSVPVSVPYTIVETAKTAASSVSSAAGAATTAGIAAWLKKAAFRAAGEEGLAENVHNERGEFFGPESHGSAINIGETLYRREFQTIPCIDTSGQAFAIWLNLAYLAPLTGLFVRFFIRSYRRGGANARNTSHRRKGSKSAVDAARNVSREVESLGKAAEDGLGDVANGFKRAVNNNTPKSVDKRRVSSTIEKQYQKFEHGAEEIVSDIKDSVKRSGSVKGSPSLRRTSSQKSDKLRTMFEKGEANGNRSESPARDGANKTKQNTEAAADSIKSMADGAMERLEETAEAAVRKTKEAVGMTESWVTGDGEDFKSLSEEVSDKVQDIKDDSEAVPTDGTADEEETSTPPDHSNSTPSTSKAEPESEDSSRRPSSQSQTSATRERSPQKGKSKIPKSTTMRSQSPVKKSGTASANRPTSRGSDSPANNTNKSTTNGTKQQQKPDPTTARKDSDNNTHTVEDGGSEKLPRPSSSDEEKKIDITTPSSNDEETNGSLTQEHASSTLEGDDKKDGEGKDGEGKGQEQNKKDGQQGKKKGKKHGGGKDKGKSSKSAEDDRIDGIDGAGAGEEKKEEGLSTTDPKQDGTSYAEKIAKADS